MSSGTGLRGHEGPRLLWRWEKQLSLEQSRHDVTGYRRNTMVRRPERDRHTGESSYGRTGLRVCVCVCVTGCVCYPVCRRRPASDWRRRAGSVEPRSRCQSGGGASTLRHTAPPPKHTPPTETRRAQLLSTHTHRGKVLQSSSQQLNQLHVPECTAAPPPSLTCAGGQLQVCV